MALTKTDQKKSRILSIALSLILLLAGLGLSTSSSDFQFWYRSTWQILGLEWSFILFYFIATQRLFPLAHELSHHYRRPLLFVGLWLLVVLVSYLSSTHYSHGNLLAVMRLCETFTHLVCFVVLWDFFSRFSPNYHLICFGLVVSALLIAVLLGIGLLNGDQGVGVWNLPIPHWGMLHVNDNIRRLGYLFETAIVVSLCFLTRKGWRFVTGILIAILAFFLLWLGGRASILGVIAGTGFYMVLRTENRKKSLKFLAWILLMLFLIWIVFHIRTPGLEKIGTTIVERTVGASTLDQMSTGRLSLWSLILEEWSRSPWVGTGPQSCFFYPGREEKIIHAHNFVLQFLGEWGILGASLFLLLLAGTLRRGWSHYRDDSSPSRPVRLTTLSLILALSVTGLFGGTYFFAQTSLYLLIAYALWASTPSPDAGAPQ